MRKLHSARAQPRNVCFSSYGSFFVPFVPSCEKNLFPALIPELLSKSNVVDLDPDNPLAAEIRQEMAHSYFASLRKMIAALDALKQFDQNSASPTDLPHSTNSLPNRTQLLNSAVERLHFVLIQREAMKLPWHDSFFENYDIPEEVKTHIRPNPEKPPDN
jgi:hypothetical protein